MELNTIAPPAGSKKPRRRVGRGIGSGLGKTAGRGHNGQHSRAGGYTVPRQNGIGEGKGGRGKGSGGERATWRSLARHEGLAGSRVNKTTTDGGGGVDCW